MHFYEGIFQYWKWARSIKDDFLASFGRVHLCATSKQVPATSGWQELIQRDRNWFIRGWQNLSPSEVHPSLSPHAPSLSSHLFSFPAPTGQCGDQGEDIPEGWKEENHSTSFYFLIASCAAELKICNLASKSISTPAWPTEQSQTIQFQFKSLLLALF